MKYLVINEFLFFKKKIRLLLISHSLSLFFLATKNKRRQTKAAVHTELAVSQPGATMHMHDGRKFAPGAKRSGAVHRWGRHFTEGATHHPDIRRRLSNIIWQHRQKVRLLSFSHVSIVLVKNDWNKISIAIFKVLQYLR